MSAARSEAAKSRRKGENNLPVEAQFGTRVLYL